MIIVLIIIALSSIYVLFNWSGGNDEPSTINLNRQSSSIDHLDVQVTPLSEEEFEEFLGMVGFLVWPGIENTLEEDFPDGYYGDIALTSPQDVLTAGIHNGSDALDFILKVFYNYEEIPFQVLGAEDYDTEFLFSLEFGYRIDIPFQLDENLGVSDTTSKLTVGVFVAPDRFSMFDDELFNADYALALNFEIDYGSDDLLVLPVEEADVIHSEAFTYAGVLVNQDFAPYDSDLYEGNFRLPPNPVQANPGEEIELAFVANASGIINEPVDSYVIISMLDWHQIDMNGKPYFLVRKEEGNETAGQHGRFSIIAPDEPGFYEFAAIIIPNPTTRRSINNFFPLDAAWRFTIEVLE